LFADMRRFHLFELEDQPWFPAVVRDLATDYLHFIETRFALHRPAVAPLRDALRATGASRVVDLCSGGGGPILLLQRALADEGIAVRFTLTDRFPNLMAFRETAARSQGTIDFVAEPVDARSVPDSLTGFRTLFNAFHHFRPDAAMAVLRDAARAGQPIGIFEISDRALSTLLPMLLLTPWMVLIATPFVRPFLWRRVFWTYVVPLVPLTCWWDGLVSQLRAYTPAELESLAHTAAVETYAWRAGRVPIVATPGYLTYLVGHAAVPASGSTNDLSFHLHPSAQKARAGDPG
jgi:SAM-dependent methyltransferase